MGSNDQRGGQAGPVKAAAVLASAVAAAVGEGKTTTDVEAATKAKHAQITLILLTLTGISLRTSGNALCLCAHLSCSYKMAAVVAGEEATRVTKGATRTTSSVSATNTSSNNFRSHNKCTVQPVS